MKKIGILGGMSCESTTEYYKLINKHVKKELGGYNCAKLLICNVNFQEIVDCFNTQDWGKAAGILSECAQNLEKGGADYVFLSTNTLHKVADKIESSIEVPFVHISDATSEKIKEAGFKKAGIMGSKYILESEKFSQRYKKCGVELVIPDEDDRDLLNKIIFDELCRGQIKEESKQKMLKICNTLKEQGAECIIFGCTEILTILCQEDLDLPVFDTTYIHTLKAAELAIGQKLTYIDTNTNSCCLK